MDLEFFEDALAEVEQDRTWYRNRSELAEAGLLRELDHAIEQVQMRRRSGRSTLLARVGTCFPLTRIRLSTS